MSGDGTFPGTNFQAKVIAFIYGHVLSQGRLNWLPREDDTPVSVWGDPPVPVATFESSSATGFLRPRCKRNSTSPPDSV